MEKDVVKKSILKSISEVLRGEGINVRKKEYNEYNTLPRITKTNWFGYKSQFETPNFNPVSHFLPQIPMNMSMTTRNKLTSRTSAKLTGISRFRRVVNLVRRQNLFRKLLQHKPGCLKTFIGPIQADGTRELLTFDVNQFKPDKYTQETLGLKAIAIFMRPTLLRSDEEIKYLHRYTLRLKCLRKYPIFVRMELSRCLLYDKLEKGRVVLRQGDIGYYFYFIISGSVIVEIDTVNEDTGQAVKVIAGELKAGASFGDVALVRESHGVATFICHETSEFLKVAKPDFDEMLKKNHERELQHCMDLLHKHQLFRNWDGAHLDITIGSSKMNEYMHGELVCKDLSAPCEEVHCVVRGTCLVIQKVKLWETVALEQYPKSVSLWQSAVVSKEFVSSGNTYRFFGKLLYQKVVRYWAIRTLKEGDFFGLGEGKEDMSVVASDKTIILLVHKSIIREYGTGSILGHLRSQLIKFYPSKEESLKNFIIWKRWKEYQKKVVLEAIDRKLECESKDNYILAT